MINKKYLYDFFYILLFIVNKNLNINSYPIENSTEKVSYIKLALNKDYETSSKIKL
jgi:hypothetical protein